VKRAARFSCAALGMLAFGCGEASVDETASQKAAITGGELSGAEHDAVVRVVARQPKPYDAISCSGVLLAPNLVVTALHCAAVFDARAPYECRTNGSLEPTLAGGWIGPTLAPESIEVYVGTTPPPTVAARGRQVYGSGSTAICIDDIAFVVLDTVLSSPGLPVRLERPVVKGESMTVVGYGPDGSAEIVRARRSGVRVLDVGPDDTSDGLGTAAPRTFVVGDGPCSGDNGAPALSDDTGAVTGVFVFTVAGNCTQPGSRGWFTKLAPYARLLHSASEAAGSVPRVEARPRAAAPASGPSSCAFGAGHARRQSPAGALAVLVALLAYRRAGRARSEALGRSPR
jgi:hypothetical protein